MESKLFIEHNTDAKKWKRVKTGKQNACLWWKVLTKCKRNHNVKRRVFVHQYEMVFENFLLMCKQQQWTISLRLWKERIWVSAWCDPVLCPGLLKLQSKLLKSDFLIHQNVEKFWYKTTFSKKCLGYFYIVYILKKSSFLELYWSGYDVKYSFVLFISNKTNTNNNLTDWRLEPK